MDLNPKVFNLKNSHRKLIKIPPESKELAELMGIEFGDGGINNPWQVVISMNSKLDKDFSVYISKLFNKLFGIKTASRKRPNQKCLVVVASGRNVVDFFVEKGAVRGNKIAQQINIPEWIYKDSEYEKCFVRGLVDTDGCLFIHRHKINKINYKNIGLCFTSYSKKLIISVSDILKKFGIEPHITGQGRHVYLYKKEAVLKYLDIFGSSNPRILNKYKEWRGARVV